MRRRAPSKTPARWHDDSKMDRGGRAVTERHRKVATYERAQVSRGVAEARSEMIVRIESATYWKVARASPMSPASSIIEA